MTNTVDTKHKKSRKLPRNIIFSIRKVKNQKKWTREEDEMLICLAEKYNEKHWKEISKTFAKKNSLQCFSRYKRIRPGIIKGSWKKEEDTAIVELVNKYGKSWSKISKMLGTRNGKQIRDRFINVLDPEIKKGKFTDEEDNKLIMLYNQYGPRWASISKYYLNRTADMIKNRFHSSIKKKMEDTKEFNIVSQDYADLHEMNYKINCPGFSSEAVSGNISQSLISNSGLEYFDNSGKIYTRTNSTDQADNLISYSPLESSEVLLDSSNSLNYLLRESKEEPYYNYPITNMDWNIEDFFTY